MFLDNELLFSENQEPYDVPGGTATFTTGTRTSFVSYQRGPFLDGGGIATGNESTGDLAVPGLCTGVLHFLTTVAPASGGAATIEVQLVSSAAAALTTPTIHARSGVLAFDGGAFDVEDTLQLVPGPNQLWLEYVGILIVIAGANLTDDAPGFSFTAAWVPAVDVVRTYATGMTFGY
jgi:hypothetical protein